MLQVGGQVNLSQFTPHPPKLGYYSKKKGEVDLFVYNHREIRPLLVRGGKVHLQEPWSDLNSDYPLVTTSNVFIVVFRSLASNLK